MVDAAKRLHSNGAATAALGQRIIRVHESRIPDPTRTNALYYLQPLQNNVIVTVDNPKLGEWLHDELLSDNTSHKMVAGQMCLWLRLL